MLENIHENREKKVYKAIVLMITKMIQKPKRATNKSTFRHI